MAPDETPVPPAQSPKADQTHAPTEAELSRIAREAVRQPADPRLDKQLERMGLTDTPAAPRSTANAHVPIDPTIQALQARLRRVESTVWKLGVAVGILAVAVIVLFLR